MKPDALLPGGVDAVEVNGVTVRKGSVGAFLISWRLVPFAGEQYAARLLVCGKLRCDVLDRFCCQCIVCRLPGVYHDHGGDGFHPLFVGQADHGALPRGASAARSRLRRGTRCSRR